MYLPNEELPGHRFNFKQKQNIMAFPVAIDSFCEIFISRKPGERPLRAV
jgi:hypothetical protein